MTTPLDRRLDGPDPVSLVELNATASLQVRRDRKYLVPVVSAALLVERLEGAARILEIEGRRAFGYESVYYDTPGLASFLAAARRRPHRFKVRTRRYLDSGLTLLELKTRDGRGHTVKDRVERDPRSGRRLAAAELLFLGSHPEVDGAAASLAPVLVNRYRRATLLLADGGRVTIDVGLEAGTPDGRGVALRDTAIVETKSPGPPSLADRLLWEAGLRPARVSKFCTSLAAIRPELPANRWTQALRRSWVTRPSGLGVSLTGSHPWPLLPDAAGAIG